MVKENQISWVCRVKGRKPGEETKGSEIASLSTVIVSFVVHSDCEFLTSVSGELEYTGW